MPIPIEQILADGESGRTVTHRGRQVVFRHSIYTRLNDAVETLRDRIVLAVDGPVWELVSPDTVVRSHAFTSLLTWRAPSPAARLCGQAAIRFLTGFSSGLCDLHHKKMGDSKASRQ